jgi:hypothetical protein
MFSSSKKSLLLSTIFTKYLKASIVIFSIQMLVQNAFGAPQLRCEEVLLNHSTTHRFVDLRALKLNPLVMSQVVGKEFTVPEFSFVQTRTDDTSAVSKIQLKSAHPNDTAVVNLRRPFVHAHVSDLLTQSSVTIDTLNSVFKIPNGTAEDYIAIGDFAHGVESYDLPFERPVQGNEKSRYWFAILPKSVQVTKSAIQVEWFSEGAGNHLQVHTSLNAPIFLIPENFKILESQSRWISSQIEDRRQNGPLDIFGNMNQPVLIRGELIYALMGLKSQNGPQEFSFANGITGNLSVGKVLASAAHMATDQLSRNSYIQEYSLKLNSKENQRLLEYFLMNNQTGEITELYNTIFQNCIGEAIKAIQYATAQRGYGYRVDADQYNPYTVPEYLMSLNLIGGDPLILNKYYQAPVQEQVTPENEKVVREVNLLKPILKSTHFDYFVRQFAYETSLHNWKVEALNKYLKFVGAEMQDFHIAHILNMDKALDSDPILASDPDIHQMKEIHHTVKRILVHIQRELTPDRAQKFFQALLKLVNQKPR